MKSALGDVDWRWNNGSRLQHDEICTSGDLVAFVAE
jgi:hypothetical protein